MSEILFRGKAVSTDVFVEGSLIKKALTTKSRIVDYGIARDGCYPIEVKPETVGQYTGLKDKNGKKIFEGDIIRTGKYNHMKYHGGSNFKSMANTECYIVKNGIGFHARHISFIGQDETKVNIIHKGFGLIDNYDLWNHAREFEIIGNIWEDGE